MMVIDSCRLPQMTMSIPIALHVHHRALHYNLELHCIHGLYHRLGRLLRVQGYLHLISLSHAGEVERMMTFLLVQLSAFKGNLRSIIIKYQSVHTSHRLVHSDQQQPGCHNSHLISTLISIMATQIASNRHFGGYNTRFKHSSSVLGMCMQMAQTVSD